MIKFHVVFLFTVILLSALELIVVWSKAWCYRLLFVRLLLNDVASAINDVSCGVQLEEVMLIVLL